MPAGSKGTPLQPSAAADVVLGFVNTRAILDAPERLADGVTMAAWLTEVGLLDTPGRVTDADAATARELRDALVGVLLMHAGETDGAPPPGGPDVEAHLRRSGELHPVLPVVTASGASFLPAQSGVSGAFGQILAAAAELAIRGTWHRVKACRNPPCHLGFYDRTRNESAAYCNPRSCGAQVAMRAYRARQKPEG